MNRRQPVENTLWFRFWQWPRGRRLTPFHPSLSGWFGQSTESGAAMRDRSATSRANFNICFDE